jgi:hypothetical protein
VPFRPSALGMSFPNNRIDGSGPSTTGAGEPHPWTAPLETARLAGYTGNTVTRYTPWRDAPEQPTMKVSHGDRTDPELLLRRHGNAGLRRAIANACRMLNANISAIWWRQRPQRFPMPAPDHSVHGISGSSKHWRRDTGIGPSSQHWPGLSDK